MGLKNWMRDIPGGTRITEMAIPGTHDSGAFQHYTLTPMVQAQELSIKGQLEAGVRALDIRCGAKTTGGTTSYEVFHGGYDQGLTVQQVCDDIKDFLDAHTNECVILMLKQETGSADISAHINQIVNNTLWNKQRMYRRSAAWPNLRDVRGKVLVLSRLKKPASTHFDTRQWSGNPNKLTIDGVGTTTNCGIIVQDRWKMPWLSYKQECVEQLLSEAYTGTNNKYLFLNFMSAAWALRDPLKTGRADMNPWLRANCKYGKGVVCVDGANREICRHIVNMNALVKPPIITPLNIIGKQCKMCYKTRGKLGLFSGYWHFCNNCNSFYCDSCGSALEEFWSLTRTRKCGRCHSQTALV